MAVECCVQPRSEGGRSFRFVTDLDRILIGRGEMCDVRLPYPSVSFHHATIQRTPGGYVLTDNGSLNGTWHCGRRVHPGESVRLAPGDRVALPGFLIEIRFTPGAAPDGAGDAGAVGREIYKMLLRPDLAAQVPRLEVIDGPLAGRSLSLPARDADYVVGRDPACDLEIPDPEASRRHLVLSSDGEKTRILDRGSKNGVRLNGRLVREGTLVDGDVVEVGRTVLAFRDPRGGALRRLSTDPSDQPDPTDAFAPLARGGEAELTARETGAREPDIPGEPRPSGPAPPPPPDRRPPEPSGPTAAAPRQSAATEEPGRAVEELLAAPLAATVARREREAGEAPDGADALIVALGILVFLVCLLTIYVLLR